MEAGNARFCRWRCVYCRCLSDELVGKMMGTSTLVNRGCGIYSRGVGEEFNGICTLQSMRFIHTVHRGIASSM